MNQGSTPQPSGHPKSREGSPPEFSDKPRGSINEMRYSWSRQSYAASASLVSVQKHFEIETKKYLEMFGKDMEQQQALFQSQATAQLNAWRETAYKLNAAGKEFAMERWWETDEAVARMKADATVAEEKLQRLAQAGTESWSALTAALAETRGNFDRAYQAAREAFKQATSSAQ